MIISSRAILQLGRIALVAHGQTVERSTYICSDESTAWFADQFVIALP